MHTDKSCDESCRDTDESCHESCHDTDATIVDRDSHFSNLPQIAVNLTHKAAIPQTSDSKYST